MNKPLLKSLIPAIVAIIVIIGAGFYVKNNCSTSGGPAAVVPDVVTEKNLDTFASCLTEKGMKFYGAFWCGHCANMKKLFGDSMAKINYIECWDNATNKITKACEDAKIEAFPTFDFGDGSRKVGALSLEELKTITSCPLE